MTDTHDHDPLYKSVVSETPDEDPRGGGDDTTFGAWVPTCGWGLPGTSAEPAAAIFTTEHHQPNYCPHCGADDCLSFEGHITLDPAEADTAEFKYSLQDDVVCRSKTVAKRREDR